MQIAKPAAGQAQPHATSPVATNALRFDHNACNKRCWWGAKAGAGPLAQRHTTHTRTPSRVTTSCLALVRGSERLHASLAERWQQGEQVVAVVAGARAQQLLLPQGCDGVGLRGGGQLR